MRPVKNVDVYFIIILLLNILLACYFQQYAIEPNSDGASYLDFARNVVERGVFKSNMVAPANEWNNVIYNTGGHVHMFGYFAIALFFFFGGVSIISAKVMLLFGGLLITCLAYLLAKEHFDINTARLSAVFVAISPIILTNVSVIGGPEIISAVFVLMTLFLITTRNSFNKISVWIAIASALFIVINSRYYDFYAFIPIFLFVVLYRSNARKENLKLNLLYVVCLFFSFILDMRVLNHIGLELFGVPLPIASMSIIPLIYFLSVRTNAKLSKSVVLIVTFLVIFEFIQLSLVLTSPESTIFQNRYSEIGVTAANMQRDVSIISQVFDFNRMTPYLQMYGTGIFTYLGQSFIIISIFSLFRLNKIKETIMFALFPIFHFLLWCFFIVIDVFQPRFLVASSIFYYILAASSIVSMIAKSGIPLHKRIPTVRIQIWRGKLKNISTNWLSTLISLMMALVLITSCITLSLSTYTQGIEYMEGWNHRQKLGWNDAVSWITNNTAPNDIIAAVSGDYFSWYADHPTVFMWSFSELNLSTLVDQIRALKINYLIVDAFFASHFSDLSNLYYSPSSFLGSEVVFTAPTEKSGIIVIYNVTNIAYGKFTTFEFELDWETLENWVSLSYYSNGNVSYNQETINANLVVAETPWPSAGVIYNLPSITDISEYSEIEFWVKIQEIHEHLILEIHSTPGVNYHSYTVLNITQNEWVKVVIPLEQYSGMYGNPDLKNIDKFYFIFGQFETGDYVTFSIKELKFITQKFVFE